MGVVKQERIISALRRDVFVSASCDNCAKALEPVHVDEVGKCSGLVGAMAITLNGGYAQFPGDYDINVLLCEDCACLLLAAFPSIERVMRESERS